MTDTPTIPASPEGYLQPPITCCTIDIRFVETQDQNTGVVSRRYVAEVTDLSGAEPQSCSVASLEILPNGPFRGHFLGTLGAAVHALGSRAQQVFEEAPAIIVPEEAPAADAPANIIQFPR